MSQYLGQYRQSPDELYHGSHKYISRHWKNGRWEYTYPGKTASWNSAHKNDPNGKSTTAATAVKRQQALKSIAAAPFEKRRNKRVAVSGKRKKQGYYDNGYYDPKSVRRLGANRRWWEIAIARQILGPSASPFIESGKKKISKYSSRKITK